MDGFMGAPSIANDRFKSVATIMTTCISV